MGRGIKSDPGMKELQAALQGLIQTSMHILRHVAELQLPAAPASMAKREV